MRQDKRAAPKAPINENISAREVRLIGAEGEQLGIVSIEDALLKAEEAKLDLVEISADAVPPVCKLMDYGKSIFEKKKQIAAAKKNQKQIQVKEIKFRPGTEEGDYQVKLRNPKRDMIWVALAGPASNFVQALLWAVLLGIMAAFGMKEAFFLGMAKAGIVVNLVMWAFNLFPLPPLDGGRVLVGLLPYKQALAVSKIEPYGFFIVMGLVIAGVVSTIWMQPLMSVGYFIINGVLKLFVG